MTIELDYDEFLFFAREAVIFNLSQTDSGKEHLEKCWVLEQTKPDTSTLYELFGRR